MAEAGMGMEKKPTLDVILPVYKPDRRFWQLMERLGQQTYPVEKIIVINTEEAYWKPEYAGNLKNLEVHHISKEEFDHGGTRNRGAKLSHSDIMVFMTDDAVPKGRRLLERLVEALSWKGQAGETVAVAYARQMPRQDCHMVERYARAFNYPDKSCVKTRADIPRLGIKAYFASNVCCAYRRDIFEKQGGFVDRAIFNEDMVYAAGVLHAGYGVAYAAEARVVHSHNMTFIQQFKRNFDLAVSQAKHPEVFGGIVSEGEGIRLVRDTAAWLVRQGQAGQLPGLAVSSACRYAGYRLGKMYRILPAWLVRRCTMSPLYWKKEWGCL